MSPMPQTRGTTVAIPSTLYTAVLGVAFAVVLATTVFVAFMCYTQYETIFSMP